MQRIPGYAVHTNVNMSCTWSLQLCVTSSGQRTLVLCTCKPAEGSIQLQSHFVCCIGCSWHCAHRRAALALLAASPPEVAQRRATELARAAAELSPLGAVQRPRLARDTTIAQSFIASVSLPAVKCDLAKFMIPPAASACK
jgi:hypothetical protein